ncbi:MAG: choice-of-anchor J domain-containing protein [Bacteroidetes bacterium]|nr:choice-of-anchor J domain-containing protein [Bacteroidota bacterium]MBL6944128.1 choice-of-anchor J domain-containing protein [Bacteroidales bacterium]
MKKIYKVLFLFLVVLFLGNINIQAQNTWINELHYDNAGADVGEFLEIVIENPGSYALSDFAVYLYNGNNGGVYDSQTVDNFTVGATVDNFTIYYWYPTSIQNGAPDGLALVYQGTLITGQFLSYEGVFAATDGPAIGVISTDIGVLEEGTTPIGESLQLTGSGTSYPDFAWQPPASETPGLENNGQSLGGALDPEPSNYPTMFAATTSGLNINVSWTESIGAQLPLGYLILGDKTSSPSFDVPVDGVPVANDLDWSDNKVSVNVGYGVGQYIFEGLETNSTYSFTIYPFTNAGSNIDYKTDGTSPTANATTANIAIISFEGFNTGLGNWTGYSVTGDQIWEWADYGNPPGCAKANGYSGGPVPNEDWLISPELDLMGYTDITFGFDHARNYATNDGLFILISTDYDGSSNPNTATWDDITSNYTFPDPGSWSFNDAGTFDITAFASDATYIAFLYNSTSSDASTWEVDNAEVLGMLNTGIGNENISKLNVYPNPASNKLNVKSTEPGEIRIISITGKLILEMDIIKGTNSIEIETLSSGLYIVETISNSGLKSTGKLSVR